MEERVIAELNAEFGSIVENLSKSHVLVDKYVNEMNAIEEKVRKLCNSFVYVDWRVFFSFQLTLTSENASPILKLTLDGAQLILDEASEKFESVDQYEKKICVKIEKYKEVHATIKEHLTKITDLEHLVEYFKVLQDIQDISGELTSCIHSKDEQRVVTLFLSLSGSPESSDSVIGRLQDVDAPHMKLYARRMALHWHDIIKEKLSK